MKQNNHISLFVSLSIALILVISYSCRKSDYIVEHEHVISDSGMGTEDQLWTADKEYILDGLVFVNAGQTLTIEAGTVIRAKTGQGTNASALIVARGGKIIAEGTKDKPIVFTVEGDDLEGSVPFLSRGLWGGVIILGNAPVASINGESFIEGIPFSEPRGFYGGDNSNDNSGILKYVSIRHGGTNIGAENEINGLTLGGVGSGTTIENIEVFSTLDDGIEVFGGNVNMKNIIIAFCGDDALDFDMGYSGMMQYVIAIQDPAVGDLLVEHTGVPLNYNFAGPTIANATFIGRGGNNNKHLLKLSKNAAAKYYNSIFVNQSMGVSIEKDAGLSSYARWENDEIEFKSNAFYDIGNNITTDILNAYDTLSNHLDAESELLSNYFTQSHNYIVNPNIYYISNSLNYIPDNSVHIDIILPQNAWFDQVDYKGAFKDDDWLEYWSGVYLQYNI